VDVGFRTNSFVYNKGLVTVHTDELGTAVTNFWDNLQRLAGRQFWDGTTISNFYYKFDGPFANSTGGTDLLDLTATKDRLGHTSYFKYDPMRRVTASTNALTNTTIYTYCLCGSLESISYPTTNVNVFTYDNLGHLTDVSVDGQGSVFYGYNLLGQLTNITAYGDSRNLNYNNQGLVSSVTNSLGTLLSITYDILDRATNRVDQNGVIVTNAYDVLNRIVSRGLAQTNSNEYFGYTTNVAGPTSYTNQVTNVVTYIYDPLSRMTNQTYLGTSTESFTYDPAGNLLTLLDGNNHPTIWKYDPEGRLLQKIDATNANYSFTYYPTGWLSNRVDSLGRTSLFGYDAVGNLRSIAYLGLGKTNSYLYDAINRLRSMTDDVGTTSFGYRWAGSFSRIAYEVPPWANSEMDRTYSIPSMLLATNSLPMPGVPTLYESYSFTAGRLTQVASGTFGAALGVNWAGTFSYGYQGPGDLVRSISLPNGSLITNQFDVVGRLTETRLKNSIGAAVNYHQYAYNGAHQRTALTNTLGDYRNYLYDSRGQLTNAAGFEVNGTNVTPRLHERFGYRYDPAWNLTTRTNGELVENFGVNSLNELTTVGRVTTTMTVSGAASRYATNVTVADNGNPAVPAILYADKSFARTNVALRSGTNAFTAVANDGYGQFATNTVTVNLPGSVSYTYDANGNLTTDGTRTLTYDQENQLTSVTVTNGGGISTKSAFVYDGLSRLRIRLESNWVNNAWVKVGETRYLYDGRRVIQERDGNNRPTVTYTLGADLSGSFEGAGGIGGLLARFDHGSGLNAFYHSDGSGNVSVLQTIAQTVAARYLYDPYGRLLSRSGPLADANVRLFSGKEYHASSGLFYYGLRWYDPNLQRFINRDPIGERGGINLYTYVQNSPENYVDPFGLDLGDWYDPKSYLNSGFVEGWTKGAQGIVNAFTGGLFDPQSGLFYNTFDKKWRDLGYQGTRCDSAFRFGNNAGRVAVGSLAAAGGVAAANAAGAPTMSVGWASPAGSIHFFWSVTTSEGTVVLHSVGVSSATGGIWAGYLGGSTALTDIPILFPGAAAATGVAGYNCFTGACAALRRGFLGF
jgi:RHS repeat-associated protein